MRKELTLVLTFYVLRFTFYVMFDWKVDEEAGWDEPQRPSPPPSPRRHTNRRLWLATAVILILAAALFYNRLDRQVAQVNVDLTEEVTAAFLLLWQADRQGDADLFAQLRHDTGLNAWRTEIDRIFGHGLLFDRTTLGFTLSGGEPTITDVTFSPDWQTAVLTAQISYDTAYGPDPLHLNYPLFYERIDGRWLLVPPPADYWGETTRVDDRPLTFSYPQADADLALRLHEDLQTAVIDACSQLPAAAHPLDLRCRSDMLLIVRLQARPGSLDALLPYGRNEFVRRQASTSIRSPVFDLMLPAPTLLGVVADEADYQIMRQALSRWLMAKILSDQIPVEMIPEVSQIWLDAQLERLGLGLVPPPARPSLTLAAPSQPPQAEVALLCTDPAARTIDLLRLPPTADATLLAAGVGQGLLESLVQGQVLSLAPNNFGYVGNQQARRLFQADGTPLQLPPPPGSSRPMFVHPGAHTDVAMIMVDNEPLAINLAACLADDGDACRWHTLESWPIWSPNGRHQLIMSTTTHVDGQPRSSLRLIRRGVLGEEEVVDVGLALDLPPFWLDNETYGYLRAASDPAGPINFEIVLAHIADDEPQPLLTAAAIRPTLPAEARSAWMIPHSVRRVEGEPDQFVVTVSLFIYELMPNAPPVSATLLYDRATGEVSLLAYARQGFVAPNGRFLLHWPPQNVSRGIGAGENGRAWQLEWLDVQTERAQQIAWPQLPGRETAVPVYHWSPLEDWFLLLTDNTLLLVEAAGEQSGFVLPLAEYMGDNYHCFDAVWMRTTDSTAD
jgi:hypothetical protein